ncbi:alpha/beta hydrolase [Paractinoplanes deccanensis]|uniref:Alpha/beta hydrolase n=1 Tax=Paractinoplanes deccanensis TaxID=113561 RepID=A0ABQ3YFC8_9ACTN|nr:alpha/beta hydrolase [Actinoplanes deccanensis]
MNRNPFGFPAYMRAARQRLADIPTSTAQTPAGPVQYLDRGAGFPILLVHGVFGGHDAAVRLAEPEILAGHRLIAPSRFGYLGTPMPRRATVALQADTHAALLDVLGVDRAVVYAGSAGGTSALQLAIRHPDRVAALVLQSTNVTGPHHDRDIMPRAVAYRLWRSELLMWLVRTYLPGVITSLMGVPRDLPLTDADRRRLALELDSIFPVRPRVEGIMFDAFTGNRDINGCRLERITCPTLFVHFRDDGGPPYDEAVAMCRRIPGARLVTGEHGGHLGLGDHPEITAAIRRFLATVTTSARPAAADA